MNITFTASYLGNGCFFFGALDAFEGSKKLFFKFISCWWSENLRPKKHAKQPQSVFASILGIFPAPVTRAERIYFPILSNSRRHETLMCWTVEGRFGACLNRRPFCGVGFLRSYPLLVLLWGLYTSNFDLEKLWTLRPGDFWRSEWMVILFLLIPENFVSLPSLFLFFLNRTGSRVWILWNLTGLKWKKLQEMDCSGDVLTAFLDYLYGTLAVAQDGLVGLVPRPCLEGSPIQTLRSRSNSNRLEAAWNGICISIVVARTRSSLNMPDRKPRGGVLDVTIADAVELLNVAKSYGLSTFAKALEPLGICCQIFFRTKRSYPNCFMFFFTGVGNGGLL